VKRHCTSGRTNALRQRLLKTYILFNYIRVVSHSEMAKGAQTVERAPLSDISVADILGERERGGRSEARGVRSIVLAFVRQNPDGVTLQMVSSDARISPSWAQRVLEDLVHQREIYSRVIPGLKATMYYPNGRLIHKFLQESREMGSQIFRVSIHEGRKGPRVQIQERRFTLLEGEKVEGSVFVDIENAPALTELITQMLDRLNNREFVEKLTRSDSESEANRS
jgi:hypothetical protein